MLLNLRNHWFSTVDGYFWSLGIDRISGNLYAVTSGGYIIACDERRSGETGTTNCATVVSEDGELRGFALLPEIGYLL